MMKTKMLAMVMAVGTLLAACSNNSPNPYAYNGQYAYGNYNGYQTGYNTMYPYNNYNYNYGVQNPYFYARYNTFNPMQMQMQAQAMFSLSFRARSPMFYMPNYTSNNCMMRTQATYTPSSCACVMAPCNCQQVVQQISNQCQSQPTRVRRVRTTTTTVDTRNDRDDRGNDDVVTTNTSSLMSLTVIKADARALFDRLAKEAETLQNKTVIRTGANYKCFLSGKANRDESYACDLDINLADGSLYQLYPVGKSGQPVLMTASLFNGLNVVVGGPGLAPEEGYIKFNGAIASAIFKRLPGQAITGAIDAEGKVQAEIKTGKSVKCYKTSNTANPVVECSIKVKTDSGEALNAQN